VIARPVFSLFLLAASVAAASATTRIADDEGGQIGQYLAKYRALRQSGDNVVVDGVCASACTMVLGAVPRRRLCVTPRAVFEFHSAWDPASAGAPVISNAGNRLLWSSYPRDIRQWILRHGGLGLRVIALRGRDLLKMYRACP